MGAEVTPRGQPPVRPVESGQAGGMPLPNQRFQVVQGPQHWGSNPSYPDRTSSSDSVGRRPINSGSGEDKSNSTLPE